MVSVGNHLESVRAFKAHVPSKHMSSSGSLESANDAKQRRIDELEERVNALVARMVCPYKYTRLLYSRDCTVSPRKRSVDASEVHDSHHRIRFVLFTYNASYDPLAGAPSMLAFFLDSCLERINSAMPGFIFLELLSAFA